MALHRKCNVGDARPLFEGPDDKGEKYKDLNKWWIDCPQARQGPTQKDVFHEPWFADQRQRIADSMKPKGPSQA